MVVALCKCEYVFTESGSSTCKRLIAIARTIIGSDVLRDERFLMPTKDAENPRAAYSEASRVRVRGRGIRVLGAESEYAAAYSASLRVRASEASRRAA